MSDRSGFIKLLRLFGALLPGNYLKTVFYLNAIAKPRKAIRQALHAFYRFDHIYEVLESFREGYEGQFSILEFGTEDGYSFTKMLYATRYTGMSDRVTVHTFDSFEGLPDTHDLRDRNLVYDRQPVPGQFRGRYNELVTYCERHYDNFRIHKGYFDETLDVDFLESLRAQLPILVWFDCNLYTSARTAFERLFPYLPNGCVMYFDDYETNFGSRFTGEARLVHEVNRGDFGNSLELVLDPALSLDTRRIYRFINQESGLRLRTRGTKARRPDVVRYRTNDSPLP